ncbi:hypothetical protein F4806DRAFT_87239 [Annulohypoxylon nitens]|nr:hypothetical protein F4806DRAFT_87239 [Annulohypoxylon nitens]
MISRYGFKFVLFVILYDILTHGNVSWLPILMGIAIPLTSMPPPHILLGTFFSFFSLPCCSSAKRET